MSLQKTGIDYLTHTWGIISGCEHWHNGVCGGGGQEFNCWAKRLIEGRLRRFYPNGFQPTIWPEKFLDPMRHKAPARIGVAFMGDLFGDWVDPDKSVPVSLYGELDAQLVINLLNVGLNPVPGFPLREAIFSTVKSCPQHIFIFLTKCPWNLPKWNPWPSNCWVGASATNRTQWDAMLRYLPLVQAKVRFVSIEPFLERLHWDMAEGSFLDWMILGGQSGKGKFYPPEGWIAEMETKADAFGIPVFEKQNLRRLWFIEPRRELPHV